MQSTKMRLLFATFAACLLCMPATLAEAPTAKTSAAKVPVANAPAAKVPTAKPARTETSADSTTSKEKSIKRESSAATDKTDKVSASTAKPKPHGKIDGSFVNGEYVLTNAPAKNGFHKGEPVVVVVDKGSHYTYVFQKQADDKVVEVLRVSNAVGKDSTPSPNGPYKVVDKLKWPSWLPPKSIDPKQKAVQPYNKDHKNPLGVARIGLNKFGVFLHGTNDPKSIRSDASHGCIRHSNADILKVFSMVNRGTTVLITDHMVGTKVNKKEFASDIFPKKS